MDITSDLGNATFYTFCPLAYRRYHGLARHVKCLGYAMQWKFSIDCHYSTLHAFDE